MINKLKNKYFLIIKTLKKTYVEYCERRKLKKEFYHLIDKMTWQKILEKNPFTIYFFIGFLFFFFLSIVGRFVFPDFDLIFGDELIVVFIRIFLYCATAFLSFRIDYLKEREQSSVVKEVQKLEKFKAFKDSHY